jgi:hypothetical protein
MINESSFSSTDVQKYAKYGHDGVAETDISLGSICYYCKKQGHYAYNCPKKLKVKIRNLIPEEYKKTWDQIVKRKRIPLGFVSVLPVDFQLLTYIKRFNETRALYNAKVDKEIESIMTYEDQKFIGECKEKWVKKKKTRASVVEAEEKNRHQIMQQIVKKVDEKNIMDISKKLNDVIEAKNNEKIPLEEAQLCVQQLANDKKEHDDALSKLLDNFFPSTKIEIKKETLGKEKKPESPKNSSKSTDTIECINKPDVKRSQGYYTQDNVVYKCNGEYYDIMMPEMKEDNEKKPKKSSKQEKGEYFVGATLKKVMNKGKYLRDNEYIKQKKFEEKKNNMNRMMWNQYQTQKEIINAKHADRDRYLQERRDARNGDDDYQ